MRRLIDWVQSKGADAVPGVGRMFMVCRECHRVVPYYRVYGPSERALTSCYCGHDTYRTAVIPNWKAALWLLWGFVLTRKGDPRLPIRKMDSPYA